MLRNADLAMYVAKSRDKGQFAIYERAMHDDVMERLELEADLRWRVERSEFQLEYQPIVSLVTGEVHGAEALVRWNHPERGMVPPALRGLAEETGLIIPIGRWVLRRPASARASGAALAARRPAPQMSVNLSARHFQDPSMRRWTCGSALDDSGLDPWALTLEITESVLMQRSARDRSRSCARSRRSACTWRSTTSGPATHRWGTCSSSRSTS